MTTKMEKMRELEDHPAKSQKKKAKVKYSKESVIMSHCVALVVNSGQPFSIFADEAMKSLITLAKKAAKEEVEINPETVKKAALDSEHLDMSTLQECGAWDSDDDEVLEHTGQNNYIKILPPPLDEVTVKSEPIDPFLQYEGSLQQDDVTVQNPFKKRKIDDSSAVEGLSSNPTASALLSLTSSISELTSTIKNYMHARSGQI